MHIFVQLELGKGMDVAGSPLPNWSPTVNKAGFWHTGAEGVSDPEPTASIISFEQI